MVICQFMDQSAPLPPPTKKFCGLNREVHTLLFYWSNMNYLLHYTNIIQTLYKHYTNIIQALYKHYTNIIQTLYKHYTNIIQALYKHYTNIIQALYKHYTNIIQALYKHYTNIIQALYKHYTSIIQTLYKHRSRNRNLYPILTAAAPYPIICTGYVCKVKQKDKFYKWNIIDSLSYI